MAKFVLSFAGRENDRTVVDCGTVAEARNEAIRRLGSYLMEHPGFADEGHWRVNVEDDAGSNLLHVIVATVPAHRVDSSTR